MAGAFFFPHRWTRAAALNCCPDGETLRAGIYRLTFDTASYHHAQNHEGLYPVIEITFQVRGGESHLHIPLLLSPHGYTTYRGS